MSIWTSLEPSSCTVEAGAATTVTLRIRNTGDIVDEYRITPLGEVARWITVEPAALTLYPGSTGTVDISVAPPRSPDSAAGPHPYAVQVAPAEDRGATTVVEGVVAVAPFSETHAELVPPNFRGRLRGRTKIAVDNLGNTPATVGLSARDSGDRLDCTLRPTSVQIPPGRAVFGEVRVAPRQFRWIGGKETVPVTVTVRSPGAAPLDLEAGYTGSGLLPGWLAGVGGVCAALAAAGLALWLAAAPSVASRAKPAVESSGPAASVVPVAPAPPTPTPSDAAPGDIPPDQASGGEKAGSNGGGGGGGAGGGGGGEGGDGGGGGEGGDGEDGGGPTTPGVQQAAPTLPVKAGDRVPNLFVAFAQERLRRLSSGNSCRLASPVARGVMDAATVEKLTCYQEATDRHKRTPAGNLIASDGAGNLGRATMTSLWMFDVIGDTGKVASGQDNWQIYSTRAALVWADQVAFDSGNLTNAEDHARQALTAWSGGVFPTAQHSSVTNRLGQYQTDQPVAAGSTSQALTALISGWVKQPSSPGSVEAEAWPRP